MVQVTNYGASLTLAHQCFIYLLKIKQSLVSLYDFNGKEVTYNAEILYQNNRVTFNVTLLFLGMYFFINGKESVKNFLRVCW